jgi:hypothetical protein
MAIFMPNDPVDAFAPFRRDLRAPLGLSSHAISLKPRNNVTLEKPISGGKVAILEIQAQKGFRRSGTWSQLPSPKPY